MKRYTLVKRTEKLEYNFDGSSEKLSKFKEDIKKTNSNSKSTFFYGPVKIKGNVCTFYKYCKLRNPDELKSIDEMTTQYSKEELIEEFKLKDEEELLIAYRYNKEINILEVLSKADSIYLDHENLKDIFIEKCKNFDFVNQLNRDTYINKIGGKDLEKALDDLLDAKIEVIGGQPIHSLYFPSIMLFNKITGKSYRNERYIIDMVRDRDFNKKIKRNKGKVYKIEEYHQMTLKELYGE